MDELLDLYQELIMDHNARPRNYGPLALATHAAEGVNPLCGDKIAIECAVDGATIAAVQFTGQGCAISKASASLMTDALRGLDIAGIEALHKEFVALVTSRDEISDEQLERLGKLAAFAGVRGFPMRVKCATLAWHTLQAALGGGRQTVSTES